jgi:hypothetical protein
VQSIFVHAVPEMLIEQLATRSIGLIKFEEQHGLQRRVNKVSLWPAGVRAQSDPYSFVPLTAINMFATLF